MLTATEKTQAAANGWQLCEVYDAQSGKLTLAVLPTDFSRRSSADVQNLVTHMAKNRDALAIRALTLIAQFNLKRGK